MSRDLVTLATGKTIATGVAEAAEAAQLSPDPRFNPVLLQPRQSNIYCDLFSRNYEVELFLWGEWQGTTTIAALHERIDELSIHIREGVNQALTHAELVIAEGAGNPAEGGPLARLSNLTVADLADAACLLVSDSENGGPISAALGTIALLQRQGAADRLFGLVLNRGVGPLLDAEASEHWLQATGLPVLGDVCYAAQESDLHDALVRERVDTRKHGRIRSDKWYDLLAELVSQGLEWNLIQSKFMSDQKLLS